MKFKTIDTDNELRRGTARGYDEPFERLVLSTPKERPDATHISCTLCGSPTEIN